MTAELATIDKSAVSVVSMLEHAKQWLATAVETTGPAEIAAAKAQIVTAETYARELHLSKDIQQDAQEMVRRAEYALGKAIRKGQAEGTVARRGDVGSDVGLSYGKARSSRGDDLVRPGDLIPHTSERHAIYALAAVDAATFEEALTEAKDEGQPTRANLVRKVSSRNAVSTVPTTRDTRADLIEDLAAQGFSSRQMPAKVGVSEETVRLIAREYGIEIPADRSVGRTRRINSTHIVVQTASALEGLVTGIDLIDWTTVDPAEASQWVDSLTDSLKKLRRFVEQTKETTQ